MKIDVINIEGKKIENVEILDAIFSLKPNKKIIQSVLDYQMNLFKPRTAKTKQRNEIKGSTAKIYAQKGTGGARHSSRKAPIFVGGGIAHGPKGNVYKMKKINKKVKKLALLHLLSQKNKVKSLHVVEDFKSEIKKTDTVLIILDSCHDYDHVLRELEIYSQLLRNGSYIIVTDGLQQYLNVTPRAKKQYKDCCNWGYNNSKKAAEDFVIRHPEFEIVEPIFPFNEGNIDFRVTHWPSAYIQRKNG